MKPSFGQVLGYIQEGEPLALDLPNRKASIYTSSHFFLDDYPNASEPLSDAPMPHTTLNPAAAFETADEGYEGVPFPRPPKEFTRPSFLPDSDDGRSACAANHRAAAQDIESFASQQLAEAEASEGFATAAEAAAGAAEAATAAEAGTSWAGALQREAARTAMLRGRA